MRVNGAILVLAIINFATGILLIYPYFDPRSFGFHLVHLLVFGISIFISGIGLLKLKSWSKPISIIFVPFLFNMMLAPLVVDFIHPFFFLVNVFVLIWAYLFYLTYAKIGKTFN